VLVVPQVNRSPSFSTDAPLDMEIKNGVLSDAFRLLNVKCVDTLCFVCVVMCYVYRGTRRYVKLLYFPQQA